MTKKTSGYYSVGDLLHKWLDHKEWTQKELAWHIGVTPKHMSNVMLGARLSIRVALELERVTGIDASTLCIVDADYQVWKARQRYAVE